jgi:NF-kappa-B-activating protein C-terminal domain
VVSKVASPGDDERKAIDAPPTQGTLDEAARYAAEIKKSNKASTHRDESSDDDDVGPQPLPQSNAALELAGGGAADAHYGKALLPGEGQALAQYVQQNLRIPRRGEIGYSGNEIERFEKSGFVMSGSRHARMNEVRLRKENQVYSAEEQRALALITAEEKQQKEAALVEDFRKMLKEKQALRDSK